MTNSIRQIPLTQITEDEYLDATENYMGFCTDCQTFTRDCTEPDAEGYACPDCERNTVVGAEDALVRGLFELVED